MNNYAYLLYLRSLRQFSFVRGMLEVNRSMLDVFTQKRHLLGLS